MFSLASLRNNNVLCLINRMISKNKIIFVIFEVNDFILYYIAIFEKSITMKLTRDFFLI